MSRLHDYVKTEPYIVNIQKLNIETADDNRQKEGFNELVKNLRTLKTNVVLPVVKPSNLVIESNWVCDEENVRYDVLEGQLIVWAAKEAGLEEVWVYLAKNEGEWDVAEEQIALVNKIIGFESLEDLNEKVSSVLTKAESVISILREENDGLKSEKVSEQKMISEAEPLDSILKAENQALRQQLKTQTAVVNCNDVLDYVVDGIKGLRGLNTKFIGEKSGKFNFPMIFQKWKAEGIKPKQMAKKLFDERKIGRTKSTEGVMRCVPLSPQSIGKFMREHGVV